MIAEWKRFRDQVELLLDGGPYTGMEEKQSQHITQLDD